MEPSGRSKFTSPLLPPLMLFLTSVTCPFILSPQQSSALSCKGAFIALFIARTLTITADMSNLPLFRDPWAKREAWRKSPVFSSRVMFRNLFPGFGIAVVAFTAYVAVDNIFLSAEKDDHHHH